MEKLRTSASETDYWQYITDYEAHAIGVKNYEDKIRKEGREEARQEVTYFYKSIVERAEQEKQRAEQEKQRIELEKQVLLTRQLHLIEKCLKKGDSLEEIEAFLEIDRETLDTYIEQLKSGK